MVSFQSAWSCRKRWSLWNNWCWVVWAVINRHYYLSLVMPYTLASAMSTTNSVLCTWIKSPVKYLPLLLFLNTTDNIFLLHKPKRLLLLIVSQYYLQYCPWDDEACSVFKRLAETVISIKRNTLYLAYKISPILHKQFWFLCFSFMFYYQSTYNIAILYVEDPIKLTITIGHIVISSFYISGKPYNNGGL